MGSPAAVARILHFDVFEVDLKACELRKHGLRLKLPEQPFQVLVVLLEKPGEIVTREELRNRLWPEDTFVDFDHGLNNAVMRLREVLGDSSDHPRFIETLPRRGYRFIAPVELKGNMPESPTQPAGATEKMAGVPVVGGNSVSGNSEALLGNAPGQPSRLFSLPRIAVLVAAVLAGSALISGITVHYVNASKGKANRSSSLVVLPLENLSGDKEQDYFADGMTDDLIASLAKIRSLRVISRSTAMAYKGTHKPLSEIARDLHVDAVVEGTVLKAGPRVRITAELVQVSTDQQLWAETYESQLGDILSLQNQVSSDIVDQIR